MPLPIEDYALIGDTYTAALVGRDGSIDWLCLPRFDGDACFAALLGTHDNGRWLLAPEGGARRVARAYRDGTMVLDTVFETEDGRVVLTDFMPQFEGDDRIDLMRTLRCDSGFVPMTMDLRIRFDYGRVVPWVRADDESLLAVAGPDALHLYATVPVVSDNFRSSAHFTLREGDEAAFALVWHPSHRHQSVRTDTVRALMDTEAWWRSWSCRCDHTGPWRRMVRRSLLTLKALTYSPTGGIVAAPTTSLPERLGGVRNWDYRYCWLRDATLTLYALMNSGYGDEALHWREWLLRAVAGEPGQMQMIYGVGGEHRLPEWEVRWLKGYEGSVPVRVGNAARMQLQLDVFGEVMDTLHVGRRYGLPPEGEVWALQKGIMDCLETRWKRPDEGLWEVRGSPRHFTHSKVMAWVAVDRSIQDAERYGLSAPLERWKALRDDIHAEVCARAWDSALGSFTQYYGSGTVDAALLQMPLVGFLPCADPRVKGTLRAIERTLLSDGLVRRYETRPGLDGLPPGEGAFLACSFWYADVLLMAGRAAEARAVFEHLLSLANDVGLLAEEYDPVAKRQLGNFPQAFSHVALVNTATNLATASGPARKRGSGG